MTEKPTCKTCQHYKLSRNTVADVCLKTEEMIKAGWGLATVVATSPRGWCKLYERKERKERGK